MLQIMSRAVTLLGVICMCFPLIAMMDPGRDGSSHSSGKGKKELDQSNRRERWGDLTQYPRTKEGMVHLWSRGWGETPPIKTGKIGTSPPSVVHDEGQATGKVPGKMKVLAHIEPLISNIPYEAPISIVSLPLRVCPTPKLISSEDAAELYAQAEISFQKQDYRLALDALRKVWTLLPEASMDRFPTLFAFGVTAFELGRSDWTLVCFHNALSSKACPSGARNIILEMLRKCFSHTQQADLRVYLQLIKDLKAEQLDQSAEAHFSLAQLSVPHCLSHQYEFITENPMAVRFYRRAITLASQSPVIRVRATEELGNLYYRVGLFDRAAQSWYRAAESCPRDEMTALQGKLFLQAGRVFVKLMKYPQAVNSYLFATVLTVWKDYERSCATFELASVFRLLRLRNRAFTYYTKTLGILGACPEYRARSLCIVAQYHRQRGENQKAIRFLEEALQTPEFTGYRRTRALYRKGVILNCERCYAEAQKALEATLEDEEWFVGKNVGWSALELGKALYHQGLFDNAFHVLPFPDENESDVFQNEALYYYGLCICSRAQDRVQVEILEQLRAKTKLLRVQVEALMKKHD